MRFEDFIGITTTAKLKSPDEVMEEARSMVRHYERLRVAQQATEWLGAWAEDVSERMRRGELDG